MTASPVATRLKLVVVPHTHWDREWYQPFEQFRLKLVRLIDQVIQLSSESSDYSHFMLDGQTIVLEDYLAIRPEREGALRALIESGRVAVGPWYVLPDEFLVSGESLIRNLQIGMAIARRFGRSMEIGYLPDSFGHVAQMPQLFQGFGFETGALWRGVGDDNPGCEWLWAAPDGSTIYVQWLSGGYGNFANLPEDELAAFERLKLEVARLGEQAKARTLLLMNGSDHLMPQAFLPRHIQAFNALSPEWDVVQGSLAEAIAAARAQAGDLQTVTGELRGAADTSLLPGVLSARTYLKLANARAQTMLERQLEPFSALAAAIAGRPYPQAMLRHAWKLLLANHPHDSICGCSVDSVHRQMMTRFEQLDELSQALQHEALAGLAGEDPHAETARQEGLRLFNPHPWAHVAPLTADLTLDCPPDDEPVFSLLDEEDQPQPYEIVASERGVRVVNQSPLYPYNVATVSLTLRLTASLPPLGHRSFRVKRSPMRATPHAELRSGPDWIENRHFRVRAIPGGVEILDKALGETVTHCFEDRGDRGDEYNFCPVDGEAPQLSRGTAWERVAVVAAGHSLRLVLAADWSLPAGLAPDRKRREGEARVGLQLAVSLHAAVRRVECELAVDNTATDHRLRALFQTRSHIGATHADTAFGWVTRSSEVKPRDWAETPMGTYPLGSMVLVDRPQGQGGVVAPGLHEFEAVGDSLALTLIRAVGWLSRDDLSTRRGDAGPMLASPEAQMQGLWSYRYAWLSADADEAEGEAQRRGQEFSVPAKAFPLARWTGHRAESWLAIDTPAIQLSALKLAEDGSALLLRVFNAGDNPQSGIVTFGLPVVGVRAARLDETPGEALALDGHTLTIRLRGAEIATYLIEVAGDLKAE